MRSPRIVAFGAVLCVAACGEGPLLQDAAGKYRVVAEGTLADLGAPLRAGSVALLVALDRDGTELLGDAPPSAGGRPYPPVVGIGEPPADGAPGPAALIVPETGAGIAVDLALLACNGLALPPRIPVGARLYTDANRRAGGERQLAPGDFVVELLRREHAAVLTTTPATDEVHRIALVVFRDDDPWQRRVLAEVAAAAQRYPQLELHSACADGDPARRDGRIREFLGQGARAILVTSGAPVGLAAVAGAAAAQNAALIALDPVLAPDEQATCCIGCEAGMLGRTAAAGVRALLPGGGALALLFADRGDATTAARMRGFVDGLALRRR